MSHPGISFPEPYTPHGQPLGVRTPKGVIDHVLPPEAEQAATLYARMVERYGGSIPVHIPRNFWLDFENMLPVKLRAGGMASLDFSRMVTASGSRSVDRRRGVIEHVAVIDGKRQPLQGHRAEPAAIFVGRGPSHPLAGRYKRGVQAEDVTLNLSKDAPVPAPPRGHRWAAIIENPFVDWLASWRDPLTGATKYMRLAPASDAEQGLDRDKFEVARTLKRAMPRILDRIDRDLGSRDEAVCQHAVCVWLLHRLALRIGRLSHGSPLRTYGLASLEVRHAAILSKRSLKLSFPGKDSVMYNRSVPIEDRRILACMRRYLAPGGTSNPATARIFEHVSPESINEYLDSLLPGLTAKVIRTMRASTLYEASLGSVLTATGTSRGAGVKRAALLAVRAAEARVALLLNHKVQSHSRKAGGNLVDHDALEGMLLSATRMEDVRNVVRLGGLSLATGRANYIDPRITASFCKHLDIDVAAVLPRALMRTVDWAVSEVQRLRRFKF
jgi:DNA topoisomerase-1